MKTSKQIFYMAVGAFVFAGTVLGQRRDALAYHNFFFRDAGDLISGILDNARLDKSSVTLLGPLIDGNEIVDNSLQGKNLGSGIILSSHVAGGVITGSQSASTSTAIYDLRITTTGTDTNKIVVTAEAIDIMGCWFQNTNTDVAFSTIASVNLANGGTGAGAGGSNIGDLANTWYRIFAIAKTDCSTAAVIVDSITVTTPVMPTGWTKWRPLGSFYNDSSANVTPIYKRGSHVLWWTAKTLLSAVSVTNSYTLLDLSNTIPPKVTGFTSRTTFGFTSGAIRCAVKFSGLIAPSANVGEDAAMDGFNAPNAGTVFFGVPTTRSIAASRTIMYATEAGTTNNCATLSLYGIGYEEDY